MNKFYYLKLFKCGTWHYILYYIYTIFYTVLNLFSYNLNMVTPFTVPQKLHDTNLTYLSVCQLMSLQWRVSTPTPKPKAGVPPFVRHLWLLIQYTDIYPPSATWEHFMPWWQIPTNHEQMNTNTVNCSELWSCCCCETLMKLNNMLTLCYALFVLHAPRSVGTDQAVNPNDAVSHPGRPESTVTLLSEPHSLYKIHKLWKVSAD